MYVHVLDARRPRLRPACARRASHRPVCHPLDSQAEFGGGLCLVLRCAPGCGESNSGVLQEWGRLILWNQFQVAVTVFLLCVNRPELTRAATTDLRRAA